VAPVGKRLLALCPHPDDESIGAGGLLLAHRNLAEIHLVCLCNGEGGGSLGESAGDPEATKRALIETRKTEFQKIADTLNAASVRHLDFPDVGIPCSTTAAEQLRAIAQDIRPDAVLLPWFLDDHVDHRRANVLYAWGCADLHTLVLGYEVWSLLAEPWRHRGIQLRLARIRELLGPRGVFPRAAQAVTDLLPPAAEHQQFAVGG
jgi:LmbE family N-acetylglucosaminyl deacetylase